MTATTTLPLRELPSESRTKSPTRRVEQSAYLAANRAALDGALDGRVNRRTVGTRVVTGLLHAALKGLRHYFHDDRTDARILEDLITVAENIDIVQVNVTLDDIEDLERAATAMRAIASRAEEAACEIEDEAQQLGLTYVGRVRA